MLLPWGPSTWQFVPAVWPCSFPHAVNTCFSSLHRGTKENQEWPTDALFFCVMMRSTVHCLQPTKPLQIIHCSAALWPQPRAPDLGLTISAGDGRANCGLMWGEVTSLNNKPNLPPGTSRWVIFSMSVRSGPDASWSRRLAAFHAYLDDRCGCHLFVYCVKI